MSDRNASPPAPERRDFIKKAAGVIVGAVAGLVPAGAGLAVLLDPLRHKSSDSGSVRITSLGALPWDGVPRKFAVIADRVDAWNKFPQIPIGAVYLRRTGENAVEALNVVCPHAGGFVDYVPDKNCFICPLHDSQFGLNGTIKDPRSPAPRAMDTLPVEIRDGQIWVKFQNFQSGPAEKIPS